MYMLTVLILCIFLGLTCPNPALAEEAQAEAMHFIAAEWAYEVRGEGDFDPNSTGEFSRGERGYAYLEVADFGVGREGQLFYLDLAVDVALETTGGLRLFTQKDVLELEEWYFEPPITTWFYIWVDIPWWAPRGTYRTVITVRDGITGLALEESREIRVR